MKTESHYFISSSQKGLISNENPFGGPYTGTDDSLLFAIRDLDFKVSGIVEFYMSTNCSHMDDKCKLALGFSHFKNAEDIQQLKRCLESASKRATWGMHLHSLKVDFGQSQPYLIEEAETFEAEKGVENIVKDQWNIKTLNAIRKEFKFIGALKYESGWITEVLACQPESPFRQILKDWHGVKFEAGSWICEVDARAAHLVK